MTEGLRLQEDVRRSFEGQNIAKIGLDCLHVFLIPRLDGSPPPGKLIFRGEDIVQRQIPHCGSPDYTGFRAGTFHPGH
jgi:hypothetical protein